MMVWKTMHKRSVNVGNVTAKNSKGVTSKTSVDENNPTQLGRVKTQGAEKMKRLLDASPKEAPAKKRSVFGDITNASNRALQVEGKKETAIVKKSCQLIEPIAGVCTRSRRKEQQKPVESPDETVTSPDVKSADSSSFDNISVCSLLSDVDFGRISSDGLPSSEHTESSTSTTTDESKLSDSLQETDITTSKESPHGPFVITEITKRLPEGVRDVDADPDPFSVSEYAESIFSNMKAREEKFSVRKYMKDRKDLTPGMRAILIDWLVEVQENFELYHETLYLAVRIVDLYLQEKETDKHKLQLIGATAMLLAAKIEERYPPPLDDFVFICDDAYVATDFINAELDILKALKFELGIPIAYRFLRRYSRVAGSAMEDLTLARYILESSLLHYEFVDCSPSQIAAAALLLAFKMKKSHEWDSTLTYHAGYREHDLKELLIRLNKVISEPPKTTLNTVYSKYSHPVFSEVAKIPSIVIEESSN